MSDRSKCPGDINIPFVKQLVTDFPKKMFVPVTSYLVSEKSVSEDVTLKFIRM